MCSLYAAARVPPKAPHPQCSGFPLPSEKEFFGGRFPRTGVRADWWRGHKLSCPETLAAGTPARELSVEGLVPLNWRERGGLNLPATGRYLYRPRMRKVWSGGNSEGRRKPHTHHKTLNPGDDCQPPAPRTMPRRQDAPEPSPECAGGSVGRFD